MALLAAHTAHRRAGAEGTLSDFLGEQVFAAQELSTLAPEEEGMAGHAQWLDAYRAGLPVERLAGDLID